MGAFWSQRCAALRLLALGMAAASCDAATTEGIGTTTTTNADGSDSNSPSKAGTSSATDLTDGLGPTTNSEDHASADGTVGVGQLSSSESTPAAEASSVGSGSVSSDANGQGTQSAPASGESATPSCTGTFGEPKLLFQDDGEYRLNSPSITADELLVFYLQTPAAEDRDEPTGLERRVVHRERSSMSESFSDPVVAPEFTGACEPGTVLDSIQVSRDGLRLYWLCALEDGPVEGDLLMASRPNRSVPFELSSESLGHVVHQFSVSVDELALLTVRGTEDTDVVLARRGSLEGPFSDPTTVVDSEVGLWWPELGPDNLSIFGALRIGAIYRLAVGTLDPTLGTFAQFTSEGLPATVEGPDLGPTLSNDCRRLYFVSFPLDGVAGIFMAER